MGMGAMGQRQFDISTRVFWVSLEIHMLVSFTPFLKTFLRVTRWMCLGEEALHELFNFLFYAFISVRNSDHDGAFCIWGLIVF